jgi:hypothetical protein
LIIRGRFAVFVHAIPQQMVYLAVVGLPLQPIAGDRVVQEAQRFEEVLTSRWRSGR